MIVVKHRGNFKKTKNFLNGALKINTLKILEDCGRQGVEALSSASPVDSGETANSWSYKIDINKNGFSISWLNSKMAGETPLVILLQYGHGTGNGGYVQGRDFINPAIRPIFDQIANDIWREVVKL